MRRLKVFLFLALVFSSILYAQRMTDEQVIQYVQEAHAQGKSQTQIGTELMRRGITQEQIEKFKKEYEAHTRSQTVNNTSLQGADVRQRQEVSADSDDVINPPAQVVNPTVSGENEIYGKNIFSNRIIFEPNSNIATPVDYQLGPGDEIIIDIWGDSQKTYTKTISPDGSINIEKLGPLYLNGMTISAAKKYLQNELSKIHDSLIVNSSEISLTLGQNRSIKVNIMGEVVAPGTYTLSSFASVFHALYNAGGINDIGSLRAIKLIRGGKEIAEIDVYKFMNDGDISDNVRLMEDDVIIVQPYHALVKINGKVKRPMYYEMKNGETIKKLLEFAGGFTGDAYSQNIRLVRSNGRERKIYNIDEID